MNRIKIISFAVRGSYYALPSCNVKEIIDNEGKVKRLAYGGKAIRGIVDYEGRMISVLDTPRLLDIGGEGREPMILLCREKGAEVAAGITVSLIGGMAFVDAESIKPSTEEKASYIAGYIREVAEGGPRVTALIDLARFLDHAQERVKQEGASG